MRKPWLFCIWVLLLSCNDERAFDCIKSTGPTRSENREVGTFQYIILQDNINLQITNPASTTARVEAGKNLMSKIKLETRNDTLYISNKNTCNWARNYKQTITVTLGVRQSHLEIFCDGYGTVTSTDTVQLGHLSLLSRDGGSNVDLMIQANSLWVYSNAHGHIRLSGTANSATMWINRGIGRISAENLHVQQCHAINDSSNEIRVFPVQELSAEILANGHIVYYNEPIHIHTTIKGSGKLIRR